MKVRHTQAGFRLGCENLLYFSATVSGSGKDWILTSRGWDDDLASGQTLDLTMIVHYSGQSPAITRLVLNGKELCSEGGPAPPTPTTTSPVTVWT